VQQRLRNGNVFAIAISTDNLDRQFWQKLIKLRRRAILRMRRGLLQHFRPTASERSGFISSGSDHVL